MPPGKTQSCLCSSWVMSAAGNRQQVAKTWDGSRRSEIRSVRTVSTAWDFVKGRRFSCRTPPGIFSRTVRCLSRVDESSLISERIILQDTIDRVQALLSCPQSNSCSVQGSETALINGNGVVVRKKVEETRSMIDQKVRRN